MSMGFSKREYWSGLPFPSPGDLPDPGIKPGSPASQADALPSESQPFEKSCLIRMSLLGLLAILSFFQSPKELEA